MPRQYALSALLVASTCAALIGCQEPEDSSTPVTHEEAAQDITTNLQALSQATQVNLEAVSDLEMNQDVSEALEGLEMEDLPELDEFDESSEELIAFLNDHVFIPVHIEEQEPDEITYLLQGASLCEGFHYRPNYNTCVDVADSLEVRLVVTAPQEGDISIEVLVGSGRHNPISLDIWRDLLAVEVDLGASKDAALGLSQALNDLGLERALPDIAQGRVRAEVNMLGARKVEATFGLLTPLRLQDTREEYDLQIAAAPEAARVTLDADAHTFEVAADWSAIDIAYQLDYGWGREHIASWHVDAIRGSVLLDAAQDNVTLTGVSLGAGAATLNVDDARVLEVTMTDGFDVVLEENAAGDESATFSRSVELGIDLSFEDAPDYIDHEGVEDWELEEQIRLSFTGDAPSIVFLEEGEMMRVDSGELSMSAAQANVNISVGAGQCLLEAEEPISEHEEHPLADLVAGACE